MIRVLEELKLNTFLVIAPQCPHVNLHNPGLSPYMGKGHPDDVMVSQVTPVNAVAQCHQKDL